MGDLFEKMRRDLEEEGRKRYLWGAAYNYYKHFEGQGYRGRILPRHSNLPISLKPTKWDCCNCSSGNCRLEIMSQHLVRMRSGALICKYEYNTYDPMTSSVLYCPCFRENLEYRRKINDYHISNGHPEFVIK